MCTSAARPRLYSSVHVGVYLWSESCWGSASTWRSAYVSLKCSNSTSTRPEWCVPHNRSLQCKLGVSSGRRGPIKTLFGLYNSSSRGRSASLSRSNYLPISFWIINWRRRNSLLVPVTVLLLTHTSTSRWRKYRGVPYLAIKRWVDSPSASWPSPMLRFAQQWDSSNWCTRHFGALRSKFEACWKLYIRTWHIRRTLLNRSHTGLIWLERVPRIDFVVTEAASNFPRRIVWKK